jgi:8-oxo-dGTP pyrophosphatase MutT (NUDIX family)
VPRPPDWEPGDPPPWADVDPTAIDLDRIVAAVRNAPPPEPVTVVPDWIAEGAPSAVLIPIFEDEGEPWILFTRRAQEMRRHSGEMSFPGGRYDDADGSLLTTALREAHEEIGLEPVAVDIVGELAPIATYSSRTMINSYVGVLPGRPTTLVPNPREVELILTLPVRELLAPETFREEIWTRPERGVLRMPFFELVGDTIWGATGHFVFQLLSLVVASQ